MASASSYFLASSAYINTYSMQFDGVNELINCQDAGNFSFGDGVSSSPRSISLWVKFNSVSVGPTLIAKDDGDSQREWGIGIFTATGAITAFIKGNLTGTIQIGRSTPTGTVTTGTWYHIVMTYDGSTASTGIKIYRNASRQDNQNSNAGTFVAAVAGTEPVTIGARGAVGAGRTNFLNGNVDEVSVWTKELSQAEVTELYNGGSPMDAQSHSAIADLFYYNQMGDGATFDGSNWSLPDVQGNVAAAASINMELGDRVTDVP